VRRPFKTPLIEVSAELHISSSMLVEMRSQSFFDRLQPGFPTVLRVPTFLVQPESAPALFTPAYRFYSQDSSKIVQLGPRMMAYNVVQWAGFEAFKVEAGVVVEAFRSVMPKLELYQFQLSFYNRIPVTNFAELSEILIIGSAFPADTSSAEFFIQSVRALDHSSSILTQIQGLPADARTPEPYVAVNNVVRCRGTDDVPLATDSWATWLDFAHDRAKEALWSSLMPAARESWNKNEPV